LDARDIIDRRIRDEIKEAGALNKAHKALLQKSIRGRKIAATAAAPSAAAAG
jgi:hypothetical protein